MSGRVVVVVVLLRAVVEELDPRRRFVRSE